MVASNAYHGYEPLTYRSRTPLEVGTIVAAPLRNATTLGVVVGITSKPAFAAKDAIACPDVPPLPTPLRSLLEWMGTYYPAPAGIITQQFLPRQLPKKPLALHPFNTPTPTPLPELTADQQQALQQIKNVGLHILHGETGTGKTRVYIELTKRSIAQGKSALILTPEIGLTSQLADDFRRIFGERVIIIHSQLTDVTRQRLWLSLLTRRNEPVVIIGPRSALFSPLDQVGLIVIDESHETAYKQDQAPYHHATTVAAKLASLHHCPIIIGSATPLVTDYYLATAKQRPIIRMRQTAAATDSSERLVSIVDLKDRSKFTRKPYISDELIAAITQTLDKKEQTLLFLNRRGTARVVFCERCAWQAVCPHCDVPLVYHGDRHVMRCHSCEYRASVPPCCPSCQNPSIVFKSIGTKAIEDEIRRLFPEARIQRFDTDNAKSERIEAHYTALKNGEVDIIIGTQTLAKGLDLPKLSLVGIIVADTSLYFPDFSAQERTYQLIGQVLGRVGRGHRAGKAILQTYAPDSPLLATILAGQWQRFYQNELTERQTYLFPPFCYILKLTCRRASNSAAEKAAQALVQSLTHSGKPLRVEGPAPAFKEKMQGKYQWQIIVKSKNRQHLIDAVKLLPSGWSYDIDPMNLL
jgi:primosomal protein N' (replication factor Y)